MKLINYLLMVLMASVLALAGCGKSSEPQRPAVAGAIDIGKLQQAFPTVSPEVQNGFDKIRFAVRYRQFPLALAELDKLARMPGLTDVQKKAVNDFIEQVKQTINAAAPARPTQ
jgi:hypothetical protein